MDESIYNLDHGDLDQRRISIMRQIEEALSEANWRTIGGFQTQDQKFAYAMREVMEQTLRFIDVWHDVCENNETNLKLEIDEMEYTISRLDRTITEIENWVKDATRLQGITKIINRSRDD